MSEKTKQFYNQENKEYLRVWQSAAKQNISNFELSFVGNALDEIAKKRNTKISVLEIGVGPGRIAREILKRDVDYYGVDIADKMLDEFKQSFSNDKIQKLEHCDVSDRTPFDSLNFDCLVAIRVFYYSANWQDIINRLARKINSGGRIIFTMPNKYSSAQMGKFLKNDYLTGHYTSISELKNILQNNGFTNIKIRGFARIPDVIYDWAKGKKAAQCLNAVEKILTFLLGKKFLMRMLYVSADKK